MRAAIRVIAIIQRIMTKLVSGREAEGGPQDVDLEKRLIGRSVEMTLGRIRTTA